MNVNDSHTTSVAVEPTHHWLWLVIFVQLAMVSPPVLASENSNPNIHFLRGQISAPVKATLSASMTGKITLFDAREGDTVKVHAELISFDCSVPRARQTLLTAEKVAAEKKYEVSQRLHAFNNISELEVARAEADRDIALARLTESELALSKCKIRAPFDGVVATKHAYKHEHVNEGDPLLELVSQSDMEVEMLVPVTYLTDYQKGVAVTMSLDNSNKLIHAKISRIVPMIDPVSQMVKIFAALDEASHSLVPGMTGNIRLYSGQ